MRAQNNKLKLSSVPHLKRLGAGMLNIESFARTAGARITLPNYVCFQFLADFSCKESTHAFLNEHRGTFLCRLFNFESNLAV